MSQTGLLKLIFTALILLSGQLATTAATYYVDFADGSDSNNGTSTSTPFQHCPGDSSAAGVASSTTLKPGDVVIFKGSVEYKHAIVLNWSGNNGNVITYDGNSGGTFGTGKAILNGEHVDSDSRRYGFDGRTARSYLSFKNFEFKLFGGHSLITWTCASLPAAVNGYGIYLHNASDISIQDCYFREIGDWQNAQYMDVQMMTGVGISVFGSTSVTIKDCEFTRIGHQGILLSAQSNSFPVRGIRIANCNMHDYITWGINISCNAEGSRMQDIIIDGLRWHDYYQYTPNTWLGCAGHFPHTDGIICFLGNVPPVKNCTLGSPSLPVIIRNCTFYNNSATANNAGTADIFLTTWGGTVLVYNCTFINVLNQGEGGIYCQDGISLTNGSTYPDYHFYNNTFFDARNMIMIQCPTSNGLYSFQNGTSSICIKNNVFYKSDTSFNFPIEWGIDNYSRPTELDYNIYITGRSDHDIASIRVNGTRTYCTFRQLRSNGWEAHGIAADPKYKDMTHGLGVNSSLNDLHLQPISPGIGSGENLSSFFTTDKDGNARHATLPWDIGAYAFRRVPGAPRNLRTVPQ